MKAFKEQEEGILIELGALTMDTSNGEEMCGEQLRALLQEFRGVFKWPKGLPLIRS